MSNLSHPTPVKAIGRVVSLLSICGGIALGDDLAPKVEERQCPTPCTPG